MNTNQPRALPGTTKHASTRPQPACTQPEHLVGLWMDISVSVHDDCDIEAIVMDSDTTRILLGGDGNPVDITFDRRALRHLHALAQRAETEMARRHMDEQTGLPERTIAAHLRPGDTL